MSRREMVQPAFWKEHLSGVPVLQLPTDRPRPVVQNYRYAGHPFAVSGPLASRIEVLSREEGVTVFTTLLAAFQTLLYRYSAQEDFAVGAAVAGHTLVFRADLSGGPSFRELMDRVKRAALSAYEHRNIPFEELVAELNPGSDADHSPLFQAMFALQNGHPSFAKGDLFLDMKNESGTLTGELHYRTDLFDAGTVKRMAGHFQTVLEGVIQSPDEPIFALPILTEPERHQLMGQWSNTTSDYSTDQCVHELFEAQVERHPDNTAVIFGNERLSYRELNIKANRLAHHLRTLGVGPDTLVGLYVDRSLEMAVGVMGILKAGAAYVPLDPAYPEERLRYMLEDAKAKVVVTEDHLVHGLPSKQAQLVCLDSGLFGSYPAQNPESLAGPRNLVYVIYTSGSTGTPKGVQIPHSALTNCLMSMKHEPGMTAQDSMLAVASLSFDIAAVELFLPLCVGAQLIVVSREMATDGVQLQAALEEHRVTVMQATPITWRLLIEAGWQGKSDLKILSGGEALSPTLAGQLVERGRTVWNCYGPTETTIYSLVHRVDAVRDGVVPIGRPVGNTRVYVLDKYQHMVPVGAPGELYIGGAGLASGYLRQPELTAQKFVKDPFSADTDSRLYRTGDLARYRTDGTIEFVGRIDHQIKLRGFRIELGEIESVLGLHPAVRQAIVTLREDSPGDQRLVASIVCREEGSAPIAELKKFLGAKLPAYMIPCGFVFLEAFPLTPSGKIDRRALADAAAPRPDAPVSRVAPRNAYEESIAAIFARVLALDSVGVQDNFFDLGGHSLLALRVTGEIEKTFGRKLPLASVYQAPTVEHLSRFVSQEVTGISESLLVPLQPHGSKRPFFWIHGEASDPILSRYLGQERPVFGVMHQAHDGKPVRYSTVEDIAAHYLDEIRKVQSHGPYLLGGYCFGGIVAFEMAQQLKKEGQAVALLVMLDPDNPRNVQLSSVAAPAAIPANNGKAHRVSIRRQLENLKRLQPQEKVNYVLVRLRRRLSELHLGHKTIKLAKTTVGKLYLQLGYPIPASMRSRYILGVYERALSRYVPKPYLGHMILLKTAASSDDTQPWMALARGGLDIYEVPGDHTGVLKEPCVRIWASRLKAWLHQCHTALIIGSTCGFGAPMETDAENLAGMFWLLGPF